MEEGDRGEGWKNWVAKGRTSSLLAVMMRGDHEGKQPLSEKNVSLTEL